MPKGRTIKRPKLTPRMLERAYRLNKVFDLRMKGLSYREIGKRTGVSDTQALRDLELLKKSVSKETAEKLRGKVRSTREERAHRINKVFDLRMKGLSIEEIAKRTGISYRQVRIDLELLKKSVSKETAEKLKKRRRSMLRPKRLESAYRLNKVFELRIEEGLSTRKIAREVRVSYEQARLDLKTLEKSVRPEIAALLKKPPKEPPKEKREPLDIAYSNKLEKFSGRKPVEIKAELERIKTLILREKDIEKRNIMIMERNALQDLL